MKTKTRSLAFSTLLQMGICITLVVIIVTLLSYCYIMATLQEETKDKLYKYITERCQRESVIFKLAEDNHQTLREVFLNAWPAARATSSADFSRYFETLSDGTTRTKKELFDGVAGENFIYSDSISGYIGSNAPIDNPEFRSRLVLAYHMLEHFGVTYRKQFANFYIHMPENVNLVYWPGLPWGLQAHSDLDVTVEEWVYIADKEHNPERKTVWTGLYYDPTADEWMISCETPVDVGGRHLINLGHDILLNSLFKRVFDDHLQGTYNFIFRRDGRLIAHPEKVESLRAKLGVLNIDDLNDSTLSAMQRNILAHLRSKDNSEAYVINDSASNAILAVAPIEGPDWLFVTVYPKKLLESTARRVVEFILFFGVFMLFIELAILMLVLRRKVIEPIQCFVNASEMVSQGRYAEVYDGKLSLLSERKDEMGTLARTIIHMAQRIGNYQEDLERQINERTAQLTVAKDKAEAVAIQLQKTQKQLVQSEKMAGIGQLSAGIAHEINNPAGFVLTNLNCLEKNIETLFQSMEDVIRLIAEYFPHSDNTGEFYESLKRITETRKIQFIKKDMPDLISQTIEGAQRIKKIVGNLKNFSHPGEKEKRPINVNVEIDKVLDLINNEIKYNCEVIKDLKEVPLILANPQQLEQVFINIIINAGQAIYKKGIIRISTYLKDPVVIIEISDNGKGISEDAISQIFNPFFTTKDVGKGTGLGLSIVYGIIKDHNGQINVYSKIGEGTRVVISLPVMDK